MGTVRIALVTQLSASGLAKLQVMEKHNSLVRIANLITGMNSGGGNSVPASVILTVDGNATAATATVTCASVANNDTVTVGNVVLTGVTGTPTGAQFKVGVSDTADAAALVVLINATATLSPYILASSNLGVVTLTAIGTALSTIGNMLALTSSNNTRLAVVGFTGGVTDPGQTTFGF
jgi:hypothetical protein